jgi:hypothetical protein
MRKMFKKFWQWAEGVIAEAEFKRWRDEGLI